jgi:hypothetical protein
MSADQGSDLPSPDGGTVQAQAIGGDWDPATVSVVARTLSRQSAEELAIAIVLALNADSGRRGKGKGGRPTIEPPEPFPRGDEDIPRT